MIDTHKFIYYPVPTDFGVSHNSTVYHVSFGTYLPPGSTVLNYTLYISNLTAAGGHLYIILAITGDRFVKDSFSFDTGQTTKDYYFPYWIPPTLNVSDNIATFTESVLFRAPIAESLFTGDAANFNFTLMITVYFGTFYDYTADDAMVLVSVIQTSGKRKLSIMFLTVHGNFCIFCARPL